MEGEASGEWRFPRFSRHEYQTLTVAANNAAIAVATFPSVDVGDNGLLPRLEIERLAGHQPFIVPEVLGEEGDGLLGGVGIEEAIRRRSSERIVAGNEPGDSVRVKIQNVGTQRSTLIAKHSLYAADYPGMYGGQGPRVSLFGS